MLSKTEALSTLRDRFADVRERIASAAHVVGRLPDDITLVAITKTHPVETLKAAIELGAKDLGENRVQEAEEKITELGRQAVRWHLVGHLQTNKARP